MDFVQILNDFINLQTQYHSITFISWLCRSYFISWFLCDKLHDLRLNLVELKKIFYKSDIDLAAKS
jgi:hypothetical protein